MIVQAQTGKPVNNVTVNRTLNGVAGTLRPDVTGPVQMPGSVAEFRFDTPVFTAVSRFGSPGRNVVIGPGFGNTDLSIVKITQRGERIHLNIRAEFFDLLNHANFGQPGNMSTLPALVVSPPRIFQTASPDRPDRCSLGSNCCFR